MLTSCGFTGESPYAGAREPDVAPWQDVGPVVLCQGMQRFGGPSTDVLGACAETAKPCQSDGDCRSRESCVCGQCLIAVCDSADECGVGRVCTFDERRCDRACNADSDCARGEHCSPGKSVCRGGCSLPTDCQSGETCRVVTGECEVVTCASDLTCSGAHRCQIERVPADLREPSPLAIPGGGMTLFFERDDGPNPPRILAADSTDGVRFTVNLDLFRGRAPSVIFQADGSYLMAYQDPDQEQLWMAQSSGGMPWARIGAAPIAEPAHSPGLAAVPDGFAVYFASDDGTLLRAHSADGMSFDAPTLVMRPADVSDAVEWRNVDRLDTPWTEAMRDSRGNPFVRLWFAGHGVETGDALKLGQLAPVPANFSVGEASSYDGTSFTPYPFEPVFDRTVNFLEHPSELEPAVVTFGSGWLLYYRRAAPDGSKSEGLAVARSPAQPPKN